MRPERSTRKKVRPFSFNNQRTPHAPTTAKQDDSPSLDWKNPNNGARALARGERFNKLRSISTPLSSVIEFDDAIMVLFLANGELSPLSPGPRVNMEATGTNAPSHRGYSCWLFSAVRLGIQHASHEDPPDVNQRSPAAIKYVSKAGLDIQQGTTIRASSNDEFVTDRQWLRPNLKVQNNAHSCSPTFWPGE